MTTRDGHDDLRDWARTLDDRTSLSAAMERHPAGRDRESAAYEESASWLGSAQVDAARVATTREEFVRSTRNRDVRAALDLLHGHEVSRATALLVLSVTSQAWLLGLSDPGLISRIPEAAS